MIAHYRQSTDVIVRQEDDNSLAFEQTTGQIYVLNRTSAFIRELCNGSRTAEEITEAVNTNFNASNLLAEDGPLAEIVTRHLELLYHAGLLERVEDSPEQSTSSKHEGQ